MQSFLSRYCDPWRVLALISGVAPAVYPFRRRVGETPRRRLRWWPIWLWCAKPAASAISCGWSLFSPTRWRAPQPTPSPCTRRPRDPAYEEAEYAEAEYDDGSGGEEASGGSYVVQSVDTPSGIAAELGTRVDSLMAANGLTDPDLFYAGQTLSY